MIIFIISVLAYMGSLVLIKPSPTSLKSAPITYPENIKFVWASMLSGLIVLSVFFLITNFSFLVVDENIYRVLALNNNTEHASMWPLQSITHLFIHGNLIHLATNIVGLGLASVYERRVGAKRFLVVLLVGSFASIPSILFYSENVIIGGISGGVFGLAAAYFTDENELSIKEWITAILLFLFIVFVLAVDAEFKTSSNDALDMEIDHIGHLLGALGAIAYCRLRPQRKLSKCEKSA